MNDYIVCIIHNNSLSRTFSVQNEEEGKEAILDLFFEQFQRTMNEEELDELEDYLEVENEEDANNHYCFSIGMLEKIKTNG